MGIKLVRIYVDTSITIGQRVQGPANIQGGIFLKIILTTQIVEFPFPLQLWLHSTSSIKGIFAYCTMTQLVQFIVLGFLFLGGGNMELEQESNQPPQFLVNVPLILLNASEKSPVMTFSFLTHHYVLRQRTYLWL